MHAFRSLLWTALVGSGLAAQTPITGSIYDGSGGPLLANTVYHATGNLSVPVGKTLTVQAGAIVKFNQQAFTVDGTLITNGTSTSPVIFTSIHDDAAGGDTNGNGNSTTPAPDQWYGLSCNPTSSASRLNWTTVRYTGTGYSPALQLTTANLAATDCTFSDGNWGGVNLNNDSFPVLTRCKIQRIAGRPAIYGVRLDAVPGLVNCTVANNPGGNYARIDVTSFASDCTINLANCPGGSIVTAVNLSIPAGRTLTLGAGVVVKMLNALVVSVAGSLVSNGTSASPVYFTSFRDDAVGGDTNGDGGASTPAPDNWYGMQFTSGTSTLSWTVARYTGAGYSPVVDLQNANITATDCTFSDGNWGGLNLNLNSLPTLTRCTVTGINSRPAIYGALMEAVPKIQNVTVTANSGGNFLRVDSTTLGASCTIAPVNVPGGALVCGTNFTVPSGLTWTLSAGVVVKAMVASVVRVDGTLLTNGTGGNQVYFTSFRDDAVGGDTNGDGGASGPAGDNWYGMQFTSGSSVLKNTTVRYTGAGYSPVVDLQNANITATDCTFSDGNWGGMNTNLNSNPAIARCTFTRIGGRPAVYGVTMEAVNGFVDNTATANGGGSFLRVDATTQSGSAVVEARNCLGGALVLAASLTIGPTGTLVLGSGSVLKFPNTGLVVNGTMNVDGPVIFTSYRDDSYGGDTNNDGPSSGFGDDWYGIQFNSTTRSSTVRRAIVRYTGAGYTPGISCTSPLVNLLGTRVERGNHGGFTLSAVAAADDLIAYANGEPGFRLAGGSFLLRNATAVNNSGFGFQKTGAYSGTVTSCLAWGNGGGFDSFTAGTISYSDGPGISGGTGNLNVDPQLVNATLGDLRLQATSPCIDAGDPTFASVWLDALGIPRFLDGNLDYTQRVDIGANEYDNILFGVFGTPSPGNTLTFALIGAPQINLVAMLFGVPAATPFAMPVWGSVSVDLFQPVVSIAWPAPPSSVPVVIPTTLGVPATFAFQAVGLVGTTGKGNVSNPGIVTIR